MEDFDNDFKNSVSEGAEIRHNLNSIEWKRMNKFKEILMLMLGESKSNVSAINDAIHYQHGGYPKPDSLPRHIIVANKLGSMFKYLNLIDKGDMINDHLLENFGLKIVVVDSNLASINHIITEQKDIDKLTRLVNEVCPDVIVEGDKVEALKQLIDLMNDQQSIICNMSDEIKKELYGELKSHYGKDRIPKGHYLKNVALKTKDLVRPDKAVDEKQKIINSNSTMEELVELIIPD